MVHQKTLIFIFLLLAFQGTIFSEEIPPSSAILKKLEVILKNQPSDHFERTVRRMGNKTISLESFLAMEADWTLLQKIAARVSDYPTWALPNINNRGGGEKFYIQIAGMRTSPKAPQNIELDVNLTLPGLSIPIQRVFRIDFPSRNEKDVFILKVTTVAMGDSAVKDMSGFLMFFKSPKYPNLVWVYADISVVLSHWIVYESLPEKLLNSESGERIRILMENYQRFENTQRP